MICLSLWKMQKTKRGRKWCVIIKILRKQTKTLKSSALVSEKTFNDRGKKYVVEK